MKNKLVSILTDFFRKGHERTLEAKKNVAISIVVKLLSISINLMLVPLTINYVNPTRYGIWLTLSSIIIWFSYFDIGFGNGLRNKFAEAKALKKNDEARKYVSTTYAVIFIIFSILWVLFLGGYKFINWADILNTSANMERELSNLALIVFSFFSLQMVLKIINTVVTADQKPSIAAIINLMGQGLGFLIIVVLVKTTEGSLINLSLAIGFSTVLVLLIASIIMYSKKYKIYRPSFKYIDFSCTKEILNVGLGFFIIQVAVIFVYETNNIIIAQVGSPKDVTVFNIAYKYFSVVFMMFSIVMSPFWSAFTEAYTNCDFMWMKKTVQKLRKMAYYFIGSLIFLILISDFIYKVWIGNAVHIPIKVSLIVSIYVAILIMLSVNNQVLNGIGKIRIQLLTYTFASIFHIPLALYLGKLYGIVGVLASAILFFFVIVLFSFIQVNKLVENKAIGIWYK
jgi:O-antigen/teichoic acid export membrane protein